MNTELHYERVDDWTDVEWARFYAERDGPLSENDLAEQARVAALDADIDRRTAERAALSSEQREIEDEAKWAADFDQKHGEPWSEEWAGRRWAEQEKQDERDRDEHRKLPLKQRVDVAIADHERRERLYAMIGLANASNVTPLRPGVAHTTGIRMLDPSGCDALPGRKYVVKGLLAAGDLACVFGAPGCGKSILLPHLLYAVAQDRPVFGLRVKRGPVFYVAPEDPHGMRQRVRALRQEHGDAPDFQLIEGVNNLLDDTQFAELMCLVERYRPRLIVVDTVALAFPGIDENASADMGRVVHIGRKLAETGAAVILVHHDTKAGGGTPRGHSILNGALDIAMHVTKDDATGIVSGGLTKNRNGPCDLAVAFAIRSKRVGEDEDGDAITAPFACELSTAQARAGEAAAKLPPQASAALHVLRDLLKGAALFPDVDSTVAETEWRDACEDRRISDGDAPESRAKAFRRAVAELVKRRLVSVRDGRVALPAAVL